MKKLLFFLLGCIVILNFTYSQTVSVTKTAGYTGTNYPAHWVNLGTSQLSSDDNIFTYSKPDIRPAAIFLLNFGFNIPSDATIERIILTIRKFKQGNHGIKDYAVRLYRGVGNGDFMGYGMRLEKTGLWPSVETEFTYEQNGSGTDVYGSPYQWTPAIINDYYFGVHFDVEKVFVKRAKGKLLASAYIDQITITVQYSTTPVTIAAKNSKVPESSIVPEANVFPNPFTTKTNIRFTAAESGNAVVELFNINGVRLRTLYSGSVVEGQVYNVAAGDPLLPKGVYFYTISNGKEKQKGQLIKLE